MNWHQAKRKFTDDGKKHATQTITDFQRRIHKLVRELQVSFEGDLLAEKKKAADDFNKLWEAVKTAKIQGLKVKGKIFQEPPRPILPATSQHALPPKSGIYFVWNGRAPESAIVYIGQSTNLSSRCRARFHEKIKAGDWLSWIEFEERNLFFAECFYIGFYRPFRNLPSRIAPSHIKVTQFPAQNQLSDQPFTGDIDGLKNSA